MSLGGTGIGQAFNFINDPLGILPDPVFRVLFDPSGIFAEQPDIPNQAGPDAQKAVMNAEIGGPIADVCGTSKATGQLLAYGLERNVITYSEAQSGGKGGGGSSQKQETGREYFMTWQVGLIACPDNPVNALYAIYKNSDTEPVWDGILLLPASGGEETIILEGIGSVTFYFGTDDQMPNTNVGKIIKDSTLNSPLRYHCWAVFNDCYIGKQNRTPTYHFLLQKNPIIPELTGSGTIQSFRANPAHVIWYILHTLSGLPVSWLNIDAFQVLADTLSDEGRGICVQFNTQQSALSFIENINGHIDNILLYNTDGQFHPKLIRDDYNFDDLPIVTESEMLSDPTISSVSFIDTINEVKVQYTEIHGQPEIPAVVRITNEYTEVVRKGIPFARYTNEYVEVLRSAFPQARITQEYVEVTRKGNPFARYTNEYVEVLREI